MIAGSDKDNARSADPVAATPSADARDITVVDGRIDSRDLFVGTREITIAHGSDTYRLRLTAQNKLILTK
jgi:hemin uptake protein HemP